jgi:hypothetical protein
MKAGGPLWLHHSFPLRKEEDLVLLLRLEKRMK